MDEKVFRVYVGNLPPDTVADDVKNIMEKHVTVLSVEIKVKTDGLFAFVDLKCPRADLDNYLHHLSKKKLRGQQLRVQLARESFLQRLARERVENQNVTVINKNVSSDTLQNINCLNKCLVMDTRNIDESMKKSSPKENRNANFISSDSNNSSTDSSDTETPVKGCLRMFQGTKAIFQDEGEDPLQGKYSKVDSNKISINKIHEEKEILEKFEMFNSVWKDEPCDIFANNTLKHETEITSKKYRLRQVSSNENISNRNVNVEEDITEPHNVQMHVNISKIKHEAEKRRVKAITDRQKEILNRRNVIQFALTSVDRINDTSRLNKKVLFTDDDYEDGNTNYSSPIGDRKLTLFDDYEMEDNRPTEDDFRIRNHFEGERGQALLSLQTRYANDERFTLDERFIESDDSEQERENKIESDETQAERLKLLRILGNVLRKEISNSDKTKSKGTTKLMLRYDPTKPDHTKFEIKQDSNLQNSKKNKKKQPVENNSIVNSISVREISNPKEGTDNLPVVSKERYYQVSATLCETLQNNDQKFSLLEVFGDENKNEKDADIELEAKPIINKKEWSPNLFKDDSSSSEDETNEQNTTADHYSEHNMKQESLFFDKNDARFIEGLEFIRHRNEEYVKNFNEIRNNMKSIVKHKLQNYRRNAGKWKTKLGGRTGNQIFRKRLKINSKR